MPAAKWPLTDDVLAMIWSRREKTSGWRFQAFALACCERERPPVEIRSLPAAVSAVKKALTQVREVPDQFAEARAMAEEECRRWTQQHPQHQWALAALRLVTTPMPFMSAWHIVLFLRQATSPTAIDPDVARYSIPHANLAREVFGPGRKPRFLVRWRSETVRLLADAIHVDQAFDRLPILADALEEAGCDNTDLLNHCRGPGPHVFGCWALDLVRGCY